MTAQEALAAAIQKWGTVFDGACDEEMVALSSAVHAAENRDFSESVVSAKGFKYGEHERQRLDVSFPLTLHEAEP